MERLTRIGLAISHTYSFYRGTLCGVARYAESKPEWLFTSVIPEQQSLRDLGRSRPAGMIASIYSEEILRGLSGWRRPIVNIDAVLLDTRFPNVKVDNSLVSQLVASHFLDRGLRHFGFIGPPDMLFSRERRDAFRSALQQAGYTLSCHYTPAHLPLDPLGRRWDLDPSVYHWLRRLPKPVGVFAPGDDLGIQIAEACRQVGLRIPEDVALMGVDDDDLNCELSRPRLSSVILPAQRIGYEAAALLDRLLAGEKPPTSPIVIPPVGIAMRRSTEVLAIDDPEVVTAVRYIREHAHIPLSVSDVVRQIASGRRTLELRFRDTVGRGIGEEIRRAHLDLACRLLTRTEMPMKTVAQRSGFSSFRHMAVVFGQLLGMTPTAYRRQHTTSVGAGAIP